MSIRQVVLCCAVAMPAVGVTLLSLALHPAGIGKESLLHAYQDLIAGLLALLGAFVGAYFLQRQTLLVERREQARLARSHLAVRATLPIVLHDLTDYATKVAVALKLAITREFEQKEAGHQGPEVPVVVPELPGGIVPSLSQFIETAENIDIDAVYELIVALQIQIARLSPRQRDRSEISPAIGSRISNLNARLYEAVFIYAAAGSLFRYARRTIHCELAPPNWDEFQSAIYSLGLDYGAPAYKEFFDRVKFTREQSPIPRL